MGPSQGYLELCRSHTNNTVILYLPCFFFQTAHVSHGSMAFVSGSWTHGLTGTQEPPPCPPRHSCQARTTNERRALEIRLSGRSSSSTGILSKILVLKLCFKVANYAKSWFHGHSCTVLAITTAPCGWLWFLCRRRFCGHIHAPATLSRTIWAHTSFSSSSASAGLTGQVQAEHLRLLRWNSSTFLHKILFLSNGSFIKTVKTT